ncbi:glycosyltransferase family 2 protein [Candidatus Woesearchaeota archaeon]|jgi:glycosyltransferase involved in cell wall biosynthesis|nr:glycosyltransferase family 2 protein [Candidatus Woesearchaeota archaeon]
MKLISFIIPSRNNIKFLKWCYESIRKNSSVEHEICIADDASTDGTLEQVLVWMKRDKNIKLHVNKGPERLGLTILYDKLVNEYATNDRVIFFHSDMYLCPNADEEIDKYLEKGKVVSLTRIEPPLHPEGPEKIVKDFGMEPEEFKEKKLLKYVDEHRQQVYHHPTMGIFAPWAIMKEDFQSIGGHDVLFTPQSKEDSDIFNRMHLKGYEFIQTWRGFVYHMTSRGSRFNPMAGGAPGKDSPEWQHTTTKNMRNFIRKWGTMVQHDQHMKPIVSPKYNIGFVVENCDTHILKQLEPWCSDIYGDWVGHKGFGVNQYIEEEQPNTKYDLGSKIHSQHIEPINDVVVRFDCSLINSSNFQVLVNLSKILEDSGEIGTMNLEIFDLEIKSLNNYEKELIKTDNYQKWLY